MRLRGLLGTAICATFISSGCLGGGSIQESAPAPGRRDAKAEDFRPGMRFLAWDSAEGGIVYVPVEIRDSVALLEDDMAIAHGAEAVEALRPYLVDLFRDDAAPAPPALAKSAASAGIFFDLNAVRHGTKHWQEGYICYEIDAALAANSTQLKKVQDAITKWNAQSDLPFVKRSCTAFGAPYGVKIVPDPSYTWAEIGRRTDRLSELHIFFADLPAGDEGIARIMHEMGHVAGYLHEHQRPDRDSYVNVVVSNVTDPNYATTTPWTMNYATKNGKTVGTYDIASLMQYPTVTLSYAGFSATIRKKDGSSISQATNLSGSDLFGLNYLTWDAPIQISQSSKPSGGISRMFNMGFVIESQKYLAGYEPSTGALDLYEMSGEGILGARQTYSLPASCTELQYLKMPNQSPALSCYNSTTGNHSVYSKASKAGALQFAGQFYINRTYTQIRFFQLNSTGYAFCQNTQPGTATYGRSVVIRMSGLGELAGTPFSSTRKDWNINEVFYLETGSGIKPFLLSQNTVTGETRTFSFATNGAPNLATPLDVEYLEQSSEGVVTGQGQEAFFFSSQPQYNYITVHRIKNDGTFHAAWLHCRRYTSPYGSYSKLAAVTDYSLSSNFPGRNWTARGYIGSQISGLTKYWVGLAFPYF